MGCDQYFFPHFPVPFKVTYEFLSVYRILFFLQGLNDRKRNAYQCQVLCCHNLLSNQEVTLKVACLKKWLLAGRCYYYAGLRPLPGIL